MAGKGAPKTGGRQPGSLNKRTQLVSEILEANGINLVQMILNKIPLLDESEQVRAITALLPYVYPKLTASEVTAPEGFRVVIENYLHKASFD
jgi:hypothetical protein